MSTGNFVSASSADTLISLKVSLSNGENQRLKLPLRELGPNTLPAKLRQLLGLPTDQELLLERFSDSAGAYITLDSSNPAVYKQLYRAAKAKLKLRIKVTTTETPVANPKATEPQAGSPGSPASSQRHSYKKMVSDSNNCQVVNTSALFERLRQAYGDNFHQTLLQQQLQAKKANMQQPDHDWLKARLQLPYEALLQSQKLASVSKPITPSTSPKSLTDNPTADEKEVSDEAPVPGFFSAREHFYTEFLQKAKECPRLSTNYKGMSGSEFTICCNRCDAAIPDTHWHCNICDFGDFDLCTNCVDKGILCDAEDHRLIKRFLQDGRVVNSITETLAPKKISKAEIEKEVPGAFASEATSQPTNEAADQNRTCNSCIGVFNEENFVTCTVCEDYDLCIPCHVSMKHGHHPNHAMEPACKNTGLSIIAANLCAPGRNVRHYAICDGCDKDIYGVRHKCLNCPDWDYCSLCVKDARQNHPGHRFVPLFEPISIPLQRSQYHLGIFCDGPLCKGKSAQTYIMGDRYKCAICHDIDYCANCEALPTNIHNHTHPLIKFKSPIKNVSVTTLGEKGNGEPMSPMGDQLPQTSSKSTETTPAAKLANAATQVHTIAEIKPTVSSIAESKNASEMVKSPETCELYAHFIRDAIIDGSVFAPNMQFTQVWTIRNPGPRAWPAGCSVRFTGGDPMFNVDPKRPSSTNDLMKACESNSIDRSVNAGEEVDFTVFMRTPGKEGKAISYWRLKGPDGTPFGHKLWCDINVCIPESDSSSVPEPKTVHIEDVANQAQSKENKAEVTESQMIFPKLDKESPVSSAYQDKAPYTAPVVEQPSAAEKELLEDVESLELGNESDTEGDFMTDEEYDLLDASDAEFFEAPNGKK